MVKKAKHSEESLICEGCETVKTVKKERVYYVCEQCHMAYADKKIATACENFCKEHKSCNLELMKKAITIN